MDDLDFCSTYDDIYEHLLKNNSFNISLSRYYEILKNKEKNNNKLFTCFDLNLLTLYDEVLDVFEYNKFFIKNCSFSFLKVARNKYHGCVHVFFCKKESKIDIKGGENINEIKKKNEKMNDIKNYNKKGDKKNVVLNMKVNGNVVTNMKDVLKDTFDSLILFMINKYNIKLKINHSYRVKETTNYILLIDDIYKSLYSENYFKIDLNKLQYDIIDNSFIFHKNIKNFIDFFKYIKDIHSSAYIISLLVRILADKNRIQKYSAQLIFNKNNDECISSLYLKFVKHNQDSFEKVLFNSKLGNIKNIIGSTISLIEETKKRLMIQQNLTYPDEFILCTFVRSFYTFKLIDLEKMKINNQNIFSNKIEYSMPIFKKEQDDSVQKNINEKDTNIEINSLKCKFNEKKENNFSYSKNISNQNHNQSDNNNKIPKVKEKKTEMKLSCFDILKKKYSNNKSSMMVKDDSLKICENNNYNYNSVCIENSNSNYKKKYNMNKNNKIRNNINGKNNITCNNNVETNKRNTTDIINNKDEDRNRNYGVDDNNKTEKKYIEVTNSNKTKASLNIRRRSFNFKSTNELNNIICFDKNESCENIKDYNQEKADKNTKNKCKLKFENKLKKEIEKKHINSSNINKISTAKLIYSLNGSDDETSKDIHQENNNKKVAHIMQNNKEINKNTGKAKTYKAIINEVDNLYKEDKNNTNLNSKNNNADEPIINIKDNRKEKNNIQEISENTITVDAFINAKEEICNTFKKREESEFHKNSKNKRKLKEYETSTNKDIISYDLTTESDSERNKINFVKNRTECFKYIEEKGNENLKVSRENDSNSLKEKKKKITTIYIDSNNKTIDSHNKNCEKDEYVPQINLYDYCSYSSSFPNYDNLEKCIYNREFQDKKDQIEEESNKENYYFFEKEDIVNKKKEIVDNSFIISNITNNCKILLNSLYEELPIKNEIASDDEKREIDNFSVIKKISENFIYLNNHDKINVINVLCNYKSLLKRILHYEYMKKDYSFEIETCKFYLDHINYTFENNANEKVIADNTNKYDAFKSRNQLIQYDKNRKKCSYILIKNNKKKKLVDKINYYDEKIKILHKIISTYTKINLSHLDNIKSYVELTEYIKLSSCRMYHKEPISENEKENTRLNNLKMQINGMKRKKKYYKDIFYSRNIKHYKFEKDRR